MTTVEAFKDFRRDYLEPRLYSEKTLNGYHWSLKSFNEAIGDIETEELAPDTVNKWIGYMHTKGNKQATIICNLSRFRVFVDYMEENGLTNLRKVDIYVPRKPRTIPKIVSPVMVDRIIEAAPTIRDKALVGVIFSTGIRNSEARNLHREDVDGKQVTIREGKGLRDRVTYMDDRARILLDRYMQSRVDNCPFLFISGWQQQLSNSTLRYIIATCANKAGVGHISPHMFRHGIATHLMQNGMPARMIQRFLGHSYLSTTEIYMHVTDTDLENQHSRIMSAKKGEF